jgi:hypothetical protein
MMQGKSDLQQNRQNSILNFDSSFSGSLKFYEGELVNNSVRQGKGVQKFGNNSIYDGE